MMDALSYARVHEHLAKLKLERVAAVADQLAETAAAEQWPYLAFLQRLLDEEAAARLARTVAMRTKLARFPFVKTLDQSGALSVMLVGSRAGERAPGAGGATATRGRPLPSRAAPGWP